MLPIVLGYLCATYCFMRGNTWGAQLAWEGEGSPFPFLKIEKCALITVFSNELNVHCMFSFKMLFYKCLGGTSKYFPDGAFFHVLLIKYLLKYPYSKKPLLTCEILGCTPAYGFHSCLHCRGYVFVRFQEPMRYVVSMFCKNKWKKILLA